jgi:hypothetical protein
MGLLLPRWSTLRYVQALGAIRTGQEDSMHMAHVRNSATLH